MAKVLVTEALDEKGYEMLERHFEVDRRDSTSEEELLAIVDQYDALMIKTYTRVSAAVIDKATRLKVVARAGSGLDKVDLDYAKEKGLLVRNTPDANTTSVAELVFGLMLTLSRNLVPAHNYLKAAAGWDRDRFIGFELAGKQLAIVGFGNIGKKVAKRAAAFEMDVACFDPFVDAAAMAEHGVSKVDDVNDLLNSADYVTVHVPLLDSTRHLLGAKQFASMKSTAIIVNTARGPVVDNQALVTALRDGQIAGAGLDVFEQEPPQDPELLKLDNLVMCPHIGAATAEALQKMTTQAAQVIIDELAE
ncbi:MAG: hydroxyacid dehydrogenase [Immundisolibacteraceae bacterium]|nr:hydroxyacid dehydrogenase [Immundisolibacteraceae bacterium]